MKNLFYTMGLGLLLAGLPAHAYESIETLETRVLRAQALKQKDPKLAGVYVFGLTVWKVLLNNPDSLAQITDGEKNKGLVNDLFDSFFGPAVTIQGTDDEKRANAQNAVSRGRWQDVAAYFKSQEGEPADPTLREIAHTTQKKLKDGSALLEKNWLPLREAAKTIFANPPLYDSLTPKNLKAFQKDIQKYHKSMREAVKLIRELVVVFESPGFMVYALKQIRLDADQKPDNEKIKEYLVVLDNTTAGLVRYERDIREKFQPALQPLTKNKNKKTAKLAQQILLELTGVGVALGSLNH